MAIEIEFVSVIVLKSWIAENYPGGLDSYAQAAPTQYLEDDHITRVGFMSTWEGEEWFESVGADPNSGAILCTDSGVPDWLICGSHQGRWAVWKASEPPGDVVAFEPLMLRGMTELLSQPGWFDNVIEGIGAQIVAATLPPIFCENGTVVACLKGLARVEFEVLEQSAVVKLEPTDRRQFVAPDMAPTRELREAFVRAGAPPN